MARASSREQLESLLAARGLAATLRRFRPDIVSVAPDSDAIQAHPGTITELVPEGDGGGVSSLALHLAKGCPGKIAWLDPGDRLDPATAARAGVDLQRLLWVRGGDALLALRAARLALQAGGFALLVLDLLDQPEHELRFPRSAWFRLLRALERERRTALVTLAPRPLAGSCADRVIALRHAGWRWDEAARPLLEGVRIEADVRATRRHDFKKPQASLTSLNAELIA